LEVAKIYNPENFVEVFGTTDGGLQKILVLAMSPHPVRAVGASFSERNLWSFLQVSLKEPINGGRMKDMQKYGLIDLPRAGNGAVYVRISKFVLYSLVKQYSVLEQILQGRVAPTAMDAKYLPKGVDLSDCLRTCRSYYEDHEELVQLLSWLVSYFGWLLLERRPAATLASLRPGAIWLGEAAAGQAVLKAMEDAAAAVKEAGEKARIAGATHSDAKEMMSEARYKAALSATMLLVERQKVRANAAKGTAGFCQHGAAALDGWVRLPDGTFYLMQCKGKETGAGVGQPGGDEPRAAGELVGYWKHMLEVAGKGYPLYDYEHSRERKKRPPPRAEPLAVRAFELLSAASSAPNVAKLWSANAQEQQEARNHIEGQVGLKDRVSLVLIAREQLYQALGPIFGGIAARCVAERKVCDEDVAVEEEEAVPAKRRKESSKYAAKRRQGAELSNTAAAGASEQEEREAAAKRSKSIKGPGTTREVAKTSQVKNAFVERRSKGKSKAERMADAKTF
jgi:hypothetical protein